MDSSPSRQGHGGLDATDDDIYTDSAASSRFSDTPSPSDHGEWLRRQACRWRTDEYFDRECSRYFDCPGHTIERDLTHEEEQASQASTGSRPGTSQAQTPEAVEEQSEHGGQGESADRGAPSPETHPAVRTDDEAETRGLSTLSLNQPVPLLPDSPAGPRGSSRQGEPRTLASHVAQVEADIARRGMYRERVAGPDLPQDDISSPSVASRRSISDQRADLVVPPRTVSRQRPPDRSTPVDFTLPRWQPDAEVTYCPICHNQFSFFVRKHHCRKCGRVVCGSCSPHRIIIPHQYIVRAPGDLYPSTSMLLEGFGSGYPYPDSPPGGERVRLCNPCVPDPNPAPPHSPPAPSPGASRSRVRSRNSIGNAYELAPSAGRHSVMYMPGTPQGPYRSYAFNNPRTRSMTMFQGQGQGQRQRRHAGTASHFPYGNQYPGASGSAPSFPAWLDAGEGPSSSQQRMLPPTPRIAEEDECPVCHNELPSRALPDFEARREAHIERCIRTHSLYGSPRRDAEDDAAEETPQPPAPPRRTGMYSYLATEKDCVDDAECTICFEEFEVGVQMARLECLCRFHRKCISAWFINHPGRCPVHQHDGFGY